MNDCIFYIEGTKTPSQDQIAVEIPALRTHTCGEWGMIPHFRFQLCLK